MVTILTRYIARTVILATGLMLLILIGILFLMTLLGELKNVGEGDYGFSQALAYVGMRMPMELYHFAPMLILLGSIAGLSLLSTHRELAVMRASGFSVRQIIVSVLAAAFVLTGLFGGVGEGLAPKMSYIAAINKENDRNSGQVVVTAAGIWLHIDNNFIHIEHVIGHQLLEGVTRYQFDDEHRLQVAYYAKRLVYQDNQWIMQDVVKTTFYQDRAQSQALHQSPWDLKFNSSLLKVGMIDSNDMSLPRLAKFARYLDQNGLQSGQYRYEFWQRLLQPMASLVMIFLAIPFVLGALSSVSQGLRMLMGVLVGFAFFIANAFLGQACVVYQLPPLLAAFLPLILFAGLGVFFCRRLIKQ